MYTSMNQNLKGYKGMIWEKKSLGGGGRVGESNIFKNEKKVFYLFIYILSCFHPFYTSQKVVFSMPPSTLLITLLPGNIERNHPLWFPLVTLLLLYVQLNAIPKEENGIYFTIGVCFFNFLLPTFFFFTFSFPSLSLPHFFSSVILYLIQFPSPRFSN